MQHLPAVGLRVCMCVEKKDCQGRVIEWPGLGWAELEPLPGPGGVRRGMTGGQGLSVGLSIVRGDELGRGKGQAICAQGTGACGRGRGASLRSWRVRSGLRPVLRLCWSVCK